jgi:hypothetical protein
MLNMVDLAGPLPAVFVLRLSGTQALVNAGTELARRGFAFHGLFAAKHGSSGAPISAAAVFARSE